MGRVRRPRSPVKHNVRNTLAALAVADILGVSPRALKDVLPEFKGVRRRMEVFLEARDVTFVDDFAHHPTAVRETIAAARSRWPGRRLRVLFEPRSNTTVTSRFQKPLVEALAGADEVWIGPIYRPERVPADERLDRDAAIAELGRRGVAARFHGRRAGHRGGQSRRDAQGR